MAYNHSRKGASHIVPVSADVASRAPRGLMQDSARAGERKGGKY
jgi:hypothetical protein